MQTSFQPNGKFFNIMTFRQYISCEGRKMKSSAFKRKVVMGEKVNDGGEILHLIKITREQTVKCEF